MFQRDRRRQTLDRFDLRLLGLTDELPRVRRQALDVPPLTLGVNRVHRQRRLAAARRTAEHRHLVAGQFDVDGPQVVLRRPLHDDVLPGRIADRRQVPGRRGFGRSAFDAHRFGNRRPGRAGRAFGDLLRCPLDDHPPAAGPAGRAQVDDVVGGLDDVRVVFDDDDRVAAVGQIVDHLQQQTDVGEV